MSKIYTDSLASRGGGSISVSNDLVVSGNLTVNGTQTVINTSVLDISDKVVGIASTSTPSNTTANGAGVVVYGGSDGNKSITWDSSSTDWVVVGGGLSVTDYEGNFILDSYLFNGS